MMTALTAETTKPGELVRVFWQVEKNHKKWVAKRARSLGVSASAIIRGLVDEAMGYTYVK